MSDEYISEQRRQYTQKELDKTTLRNPSLKCNALNFIKPFEDKHLRLAPKLLQDPKSVYKNNFHNKPQVQGDKLQLKWNCGSVEKSEQLTIDRSKASYSKYLDLSATSNRLDYIPFSSDQTLGIGAKDNITFWNWIKNDSKKKYNVWPIRQNLMHKLSINKHSQRHRGEFQIRQNSVPNRGLTTETKANFGTPDRRLDSAFKCISEKLNSCEVQPKMPKSI
ncbi:uncharacterized protein LOC129949343 [Eupeodes corollae]|uniref:uncharacterized protein LOC129949343 n=1 Tax=Eupeodes corollae TaxID=290404 RepID=UPI00249132BA|nr:uncharacterized protein LOC129949343 [Eupeodes corollae]